MKQTTFATTGFEKYDKKTRRQRFLDDMERVVPWSSAYCASELSRTRGRLTVLPMQTGASLKGPFSAAWRDILFVDARGRVVALSLNAPPHLEEGGPAQTTSVLARYLIELAPGRASELRIRIGDKLEFPRHLHADEIPRAPCAYVVR